VTKLLRDEYEHREVFTTGEDLVFCPMKWRKHYLSKKYYQTWRNSQSQSSWCKDDRRQTPCTSV